MVPNMSDIYLLTIITALSYINSLDCQFVFDDISAIVNNRYIRTNETTLWSLFENDYWGTPITSEHSHKSYRPLTVITFRLNYLINGINPIGYHVVNVLLHIIVTQLYYNFSYKLLKNGEIALIAALLFCVHPLKTEAVTGVVGRAELLSTIFFFLSLFAYMNDNYFQFLIEVICAILSKEQGFTVIAVCLTYELSHCFERSKTNFKRCFVKCLFLMTFALLLIMARISVMGGKYNFPVFTKFDNPASFEPYPTRHLTYNYLLPLNALLLLYPYNLCCDWTMKSIALIHSFLDTRNLWTLLFYTIVLLLILRTLLDLFRYGCNRLAIVLSLLVFPFIPASNMFFAVGFVIAERTLYIPSAGFFLLIAMGWHSLEKIYFNNCKVRNTFILLFCVTISLFSLKTQSRNNDWKNELSLFSSAIKVNPNNAKLYNNIGHYYERQSNYGKAYEYFKLATSHQSDDLGSQINIARTLINLGHIESAEDLLWKIKPRVKLSAINKRIIPSYLNLWINLANILVRNEARLQEAEDLYKELISMRSDFVEAYINLGDILIRRKKLMEAIHVYKRGLALSQSSKNADLFYNLGVVHSMIHRKSISDKSNTTEEVLTIAEYFLNATIINPNHKESLVNLAILSQQYQTLLKPYRQILINKMKQYSSIDQELVYFNLAILLSDEGDNESAVYYLKQAIHIKNDFRSALFNLALIMIENESYIEAEHHLKQLLEFHPNHTKSLQLLGSLYINQLGNLESAERIYLKILKYNETNSEAIRNLCVVYSKRNKTKEANDCFIRFNTNQLNVRSKE